MANITREAMIGDFVAKYKDMVKPVIQELGVDSAKILIEDLIMRYSLYQSEFGVGGGGAPEAHYQVAMGSLSFLISKTCEPAMLERILNDVDAQIGKIDSKLSGNEEYRRQTRTPEHN